MKNKRNIICRNCDEFEPNFEKIKHNLSTGYSDTRYRNAEKEKQRARTLLEFRCVQCGQVVSTSRESSGVNNRNHCPACLWSRHVDMAKAGDRRSTCRSRMQPVGLTLKHTPKRYGEENQGELMLIHRCAGCGKLSINRAAADDNAAGIYNLFLRSQTMEDGLKTRLYSEGIVPLEARDLTRVHTQLFGWQSILEEFQVNGFKLSEIESSQSSLVST